MYHYLMYLYAIFMFLISIHILCFQCSSSTICRDGNSSQAGLYESDSSPIARPSGTQYHTRFCAPSMCRMAEQTYDPHTYHMEWPACDTGIRWYPQLTTGSSTGSLDSSPCNLSSVQASQRKGCRLVVGLLDFRVLSGKDDLDVRGVSLVRVDATVCTVCAATGFLM